MGLARTTCIAAVLALVSCGESAGSTTNGDESADASEASVDASPADVIDDANDVEPDVVADAGPRAIELGPELVLGDADARAVPQADVGPDGVLRVVWMQGKPPALSSAFREIEADGVTLGALLTIPGSNGSLRDFPAQLGPKVAAGDGKRALVVFGTVTATMPSLAADWHVLSFDGAKLNEWERFPAQEPGAPSFGEEAGAVIVDLASPTAARGWVPYGFMQASGTMLIDARSYLAGTRKDGPFAIVDRIWGKDSRYRSHGSQIWGASQLQQLRLLHAPATGLGTVNGYEQIRCDLPLPAGEILRHPGSPRPIFGIDGTPYVAYVEWQRLSSTTSVPRGAYLATDVRKACTQRVAIVPSFDVSAADALVDGRYSLDGFALGDGRIFLAWQEQVGTKGEVRWATWDPKSGVVSAPTAIAGAGDATYVVTASTMPDGGGWIVYRAASGSLVARRVSLVSGA
ncbi:MAG: hypothetical protein ACXVEE_34355 [Polyangiales bacterium]